MKTEEDQRMEQIFERVYAQAKGTGSFLEEWLKPEMPINQDMNHRAAQIVCGAGYGSSFVIGKKLGIWLQHLQQARRGAAGGRDIGRV
jgi:hypothetical protein